LTPAKGLDARSASGLIKTGEHPARNGKWSRNELLGSVPDRYPHVELVGSDRDCFRLTG
jgi:hypothetical protein